MNWPLGELSHPAAISLLANNRCSRLGEGGRGAAGEWGRGGEINQGGIMGNVRSAAFYTSAQMDEITLVSF